MTKSPKFRRKELNQPDQFISTTDMILAYCSKQKTLLICIMVAVVFILFTVMWVRHTQNLKSLGMEALYFQIEQIKAENGSNPEIVTKKLEDILNQFSEGPQKQRAVMVLADQQTLLGLAEVIIAKGLIRKLSLLCKLRLLKQWKIWMRF